MDGPGDDHTKWSESDTKRQILYGILKKKKDANEFTDKTETDSQKTN